MVESISYPVQKSTRIKCIRVILQKLIALFPRFLTFRALNSIQTPLTSDERTSTYEGLQASLLESWWGITTVSSAVHHYSA